VRTASNGVEALLAVERRIPALIMSDLRMPAMDGLELLMHVKERWPAVPVVLISVEEEIATVVDAVQRGAVNYLIKPIGIAVLQSAVAKALARVAPPAPASPAGDIPEIVGVSPAIAHVRQAVALAARSDVNIVIVGETGTGKELVSRAIHRLSAPPGRSSELPFVAYNCALTPADMFDSEFFGHRRGAFTGADRDRAGILREADGGVLFLDELECLSTARQAKLLRVLDDGEVRPVGSDQSRAVSVRFVAATNRRPEALLACGDLREDLYYRLRGFQIELPALRERKEDIPVLALHFLEQCKATLTAGAQAALARCSWPGNVRQLRNALRSASAVAGDRPIDLPHLDLATCGFSSVVTVAITDSSDSARVVKLDDVERQVIAHALKTHGGNLSRAAAALGIHRSTLRRKLLEIGLRSPRS
jgi:DNA-binding NtrC family response regulator